jgi:hypothetical protein
MTTDTQLTLVSKALQAITSMALALVVYIAIGAIDKLDQLDEKINSHIVATEHRITALEHSD